MSDIAVGMRGITKSYGDKIANDHVDFTLHAATIHALVGENGAGKTTLMKALYGMVKPDEGSITVDDKAVSFNGPADAIAAGIGMVHQHFMIAPSLTVCENVILGHSPTRQGLLNRRAARQRVRDVAEQVGFDLDVDRRAGELSVGVLQRVEIVKALYRGAKILILDEPTAVLTPQEAIELGHALRQLTASGTSVVFITHKLKEVKASCDVATILRHGQVVAAALPVAETSETELSELMVGRQVSAPPPRTAREPGPVVLDIRDLVVRSDRKHEAVRGLDLTVRAGSIVGIAGVEGNGQTELIEAISGLRRAQHGRITVNDVDITHMRPRDVRRQGIAHIPEDRQTRGVAESCSITDNLLLNKYRDRSFSRFGMINRRRARRNADQLAEQFDISCTDVDQPVGSLSGGNIQKVVVARETSGSTRLILAAQPTRGVDIGAIEFIHGTLARLRDAGAAVLLVSAELDELFALADEILVMYEGRIVLSREAGSVDELEIGAAMAGLTGGDSVEPARTEARS